MLQHLQCQFKDGLFQNADIQTRELKKNKYWVFHVAPLLQNVPAKAYRECMDADVRWA